MIALLMSRLMAVPGFRGNQTSLNSVGPGAQHIEHEFALIFCITSTVYVLTLLAVVIFVWRKRYTLDMMPEPQVPSEASERIAGRAVLAAMIATVVLLFVMMIDSLMTSRAMGKMNGEQALTIDVYGHQWWWEVHYPNAEADHIVVTANEIHLPIGIPIRIHGTSRDVIHSLWAPNVQGKRDLLPGYNSDIVMQVNQPGRWRGQCAEYCGEQHAHMSFYMVAELSADFAKWLTGQVQNAPEPTNAQTAAAFVGSVFTPWGITIGAVPITIMMIGWFWPDKQAAARRRAREIWQSEQCSMSRSCRRWSSVRAA